MASVASDGDASASDRRRPSAAGQVADRRDRDDRELQSLCRQHLDGLRHLVPGLRLSRALRLSTRATTSACWPSDGRSTRPTRTSGHSISSAALKRQNDGKELTADDVVHSVNRINTDPQSKQKQNTSPIKEIVALDKYTVKIVTKEPTASLLEFMFDRVIITAQGSLRQARRPRRRPQISLGLGTLQAQGAGDRPAHRAREGQRAIRTSSRKTRTR